MKGKENIRQKYINTSSETISQIFDERFSLFHSVSITQTSYINYNQHVYCRHNRKRLFSYQTKNTLAYNMLKKNRHAFHYKKQCCAFNTKDCSNQTRRLSVGGRGLLRHDLHIFKASILQMGRWVEYRDGHPKNQNHWQRTRADTQYLILSLQRILCCHVIQNISGYIYVCVPGGVCMFGCVYVCLQFVSMCILTRV